MPRPLKELVFSVMGSLASEYSTLWKAISSVILVHHRASPPPQVGNLQYGARRPVRVKVPRGDGYLAVPVAQRNARSRSEYLPVSSLYFQTFTTWFFTSTSK